MEAKLRVNRILNITSSRNAVSYTHLDVYKRQLLPVIAACKSVERFPRFYNDFMLRKFLIQGIFHDDLTVFDNSFLFHSFPVLDVYKRQFLIRISKEEIQYQNFLPQLG